MNGKNMGKSIMEFNYKINKFVVFQCNYGITRNFLGDGQPFIYLPGEE